MTEQDLKSADILVVDDDPDSRTWARVWLEQAGYRVREAANAEEALAQATEKPPDLILLDVVLPDLDGFEVTRRLRRDPLFTTVPIVLVTVLDDLESKVRGLGAGANDFLIKPPKQAELLARVGTLLRLKRNQEELLGERNRVALLHRVGRELSAELDLDTVLSRILESTMGSIGASRGSLILLDGEGGILRLIFSHQGEVTAVTDTVRGSIVRDGLASWVIRHREGVVLPDIHQDERWVTVEQTDSMPRSAVAVPLIHQDRVVGVLTLTHEQVGRFTPGDLDLLGSIASQAAAALVNAQLFEAVEQERGRLRAILAGTNDAIVATDGKLRVTLLNPAAERTFGVSFSRVVGWRLEEVLPYDVLIKAFHDAQGEAGLARPAELTLPDGRVLFFTVSSVAAGPRGEGGWVAVMQDITHFKEVDRLKNEFVSTVSHDLRNPLASIYGYAQVLQRMVTGEALEHVRRIQTSAEQMATLVEELLDLGKIEAGVEKVRVPCHLEELVSEATEAAAFQAEAGEVALSAEVSSLSRPVFGNPVRLRQALDNLINNALKYTQAGGAVVVRVWETGEGVSVTVQDTGIGIPRASLPRLFEKFYRIPHPDSKVSGTGLGLAIVKAIVEQHGGQVWVESEVGQGSTFGFFLPYEDES